jgi:hypothetical protein
MTRALTIAFAIIISSAAVAQQPAPKMPEAVGDDCYWIFPPPNRDSAPNFTILLNRCSGNTWVLRPARTSEGKQAWRWYPLYSEKVEHAVERAAEPGR